MSHRPVQAAPGILYVDSGGTCGSVSPCYSSVQDAIDAAQVGDEIRIASGTYTTINNQGGNPQVVYIDKSVTLNGGYTTSNWSTPDPGINITELNAQTLGRVIYITGVDSVVTITGLHFSYGDANDLGGHSPFISIEYDAGGNVYIDQSNVTLNDCNITNGAVPSNGYGGGIYINSGTLTTARTLLDTNEAGYGGGAFLFKATTDISESLFRNNRTTTLNGGGPAILVSDGVFTLSNSNIEDNVASEKAPASGALSVNSDSFLIEGSVISGTVSSNGVVLTGIGSLRDSTIQDNGYGGVRITDGDITLTNNVVSYNGDGLAVYVRAGVDIRGSSDSTVTLNGNHIHHNHNTYYGGGVYVDPATNGWITLNHNLIEENSAGKTSAMEQGYGGGLYIKGNKVLLEGNTIRNNIAYGFLFPGGYEKYGGHGGGIFIEGDPILRNNIIVENQATYRGSGVYIKGSSPELYHNTIVQNIGSEDASGVYVVEASSSERAQPLLWNTIIANQTIGIFVKGDVVDNTVNIDGILWYGNAHNTDGTGTIFLSNEHTGDPLFVMGGDYHISEGSEAIDNGVMTGTTIDFDSEPRLGVPDLGADEYWIPGAIKQSYLPLIVK